MLKTKFGIGFLLLIIAVIVLLSWSHTNVSFGANNDVRIWEIQSIDTMKFSRDIAREKLRDTSFEKEIETQVSNIAKTGVTHIAISTPYDDEFVSFLRSWVKAARKNNIKVWFRGNLSGWEGWFGYAKITREEHTAKIAEFIRKYPELFEDGDMLSSCPECENGGPGDPRMTGDVKEYRAFLINEYKATQQAFKEIGKKVNTSTFSMNGDVARLVMDEDTTRNLGGVVTIDHYVKTVDKLIADIDSLAQQSKGKILLGEFGAPIPDIHGNFSDEEQEAWIKQALDRISRDHNVIGINYWVNKGSSTEIWDDTNTPKKAVSVIQKYFTPTKRTLVVKNELGNFINEPSVVTSRGTFTGNLFGKVEFVSHPEDQKILVSANEYFTKDIPVSDIHDEEIKVTLTKENEGILFRIAKWISQFFRQVISA
jgi:hypothetical protein